MRVLVLSKRQYTGKDLLDDRYGRLFELPAALAREGAAVRGLCLSYRRRREGLFLFENVPGLSWHSLNLVPGAGRLPSLCYRTIEDFRPDVIWASSDIPMICAAAWVGARTGVPVVADLYDNYESFGLSRLPGAVSALRLACRRAARITVVSHALGDYVGRSYGSAAPIDVLGNGVRTDLFHPGNRNDARAALGLPLGARLIGTGGALVRGRGIQDLLLAHARLAQQDPSLHLVLAGPRDDSISRFHADRVIDLGILPHHQIGALFRALDVGVICNRDSAFGRYCFPLKLHEMQACGLPVVAAAVGDVSTYLRSQPGCLYMPGDVAGLAASLRAQVDDPKPLVVSSPPTWDAVARELGSIFEAVAAVPRT